MIKYLKASLILTMIVITWLSIFYQLKYFMIAVGLLAIFSNQFKPLNKSLWMVTDVLVNVILSGYHKTTVSSELGNQQLKGSESGTMVAEFVNWLFKITLKQDNHCIESIEPEDVHRFSAVRAFIGFALYMTTYWLTL